MEGAEDRIDSWLISKEQKKLEALKKMSPEEIEQMKKQRKLRRDKMRNELKQRKLARLRKENAEKSKRGNLKLRKFKAAQTIQSQWKAFTIRKKLGIGRKNRVELWLGCKVFESRNSDELAVKPGDLLWLDTKMYDWIYTDMVWI